MEKRVLGKGLSALIPDKVEFSLTSKPVGGHFLPVADIRNNSLQPRTNYDDEKLAELKASIKEKGVLQPILVREKDGHYEVVAGERRLRAARELGLEEVPIILKNLTDQEALVIALVENIQREELNAIEEAEAYMEERRIIFVENGYNIRRLNQAYFAFHGAYADQPGGAAGEDPVGEAVRNLRAQSESLADFVRKIAWVTSYERLQQLVD